MGDGVRVTALVLMLISFSLATVTRIYTSRCLASKPYKYVMLISGTIVVLMGLILLLG